MSDTLEATTVKSETRETSGPVPAGNAGQAQFDRALNDIQRGVQEFEYRPMPVLAPVTLVLGLLSALAFLTTVGIPFAIFGTLVGAICLRQIRRARGDLSGGRLAGIGTALCLLFFIGGSTYHSFLYATEVPDGFIRVNFLRDVSSKEFVVRDGIARLNPDIEALAGKEVFVKGFIYQSKEATSGLPLQDFVLVKDNQACCFGANPSPKDMIVVHMANGEAARFSEGLYSVAGKFHAVPPTSPDQQSPVYFLEAEFAEPSRTAF